MCVFAYIGAVPGLAIFMFRLTDSFEAERAFRAGGGAAAEAQIQASI